LAQSAALEPFLKKCFSEKVVFATLFIKKCFFKKVFFLKVVYIMSTGTNTEIILVEVRVYEKNLKELLSEYQRLHASYINVLREKNITESKRLLLQLESLNQEIQLLAEEISQRIKKINVNKEYGTYKSDIVKKKGDLNTLVNKMSIDETNIKKLLYDTIDLDGKNETLRVQQKSSIYYISFYTLVTMVLIFLSFRMFSTTEADPIENVVLFLAILAVVYLGWMTFSSWGSFVVDSAQNNLTYDSSSLLYRMLN